MAITNRVNILSNQAIKHTLQSMTNSFKIVYRIVCIGAQWLSGRVLDSRLKGRRFKPHRHHCVVSLSKNINPSLVLVQPRKTCPYITEILLMGRKKSNQTNKQIHIYI